MAEKRYDVYEPMITMLGEVLTPGGIDRVQNDDLVEQLSKFASWITIFGSDEAVRAFHNFMQGAFHDAPPSITLRLYADFVLAARRDMGDSASAITQRQVLGTRIKDLYETEDSNAAVSLPFDELCRRHGWHRPWPDEIGGLSSRRAGGKASNLC